MRRRGSPAHAGIDPSVVVNQGDTTGLPRPRGDRPPTARPTSTPRRAPPPTRGSTHRAPGPRVHPRGSPAHAGIDPARAIRRRRSGWLPRPRGDRPRQGVAGPDGGEAPPPTRGSTRVGNPRRRRLRGSPAHAGIDPTTGSSSSTARRLPRPRGDRPHGTEGAAAPIAAPPPTRGSTRPRRDRKSCGGGSPAHAGIDLAWAAFMACFAGLPRPRGDRPLSGVRGLPLSVAPPPTRGSTCHLLDWCGRTTGSPAHAGIDPRLTPCDAVRIGLPRPRGDRPRTHGEAYMAGAAPPPTRGSTWRANSLGRHNRGSPAHAGIDPNGFSQFGRKKGLPRPRGDRPIGLGFTGSSSEAPPPTRGSTLPTLPRSLQAVGSPAHAGIDPDRSIRISRLVRLPRPRGDRPSTVRRAADPAPAPPPTRGSTPAPGTPQFST